MKNSMLFGIAALFVVALGIPSGAQAGPLWNIAHPWRHEVLSRDNHIANELNYDYGRLGGHYGQLMREDAIVRHQEMRDARMNGGYLTPGQVWRLNGEENHIQRQINRNYRGW